MELNLNSNMHSGSGMCRDTTTRKQMDLRHWVMTHVFVFYITVRQCACKSGSCTQPAGSAAKHAKQQSDEWFWNQWLAFAGIVPVVLGLLCCERFCTAVQAWLESESGCGQRRIAAASFRLDGESAKDWMLLKRARRVGQNL